MAEYDSTVIPMSSQCRAQRVAKADVDRLVQDHDSQFVGVMIFQEALYPALGSEQLEYNRWRSMIPAQNEYVIIEWEARQPCLYPKR